MKGTSLGFIICAVLIASAMPAERVKLGELYVIDGDTFRVGDEIIRLWGIDAPEIHQKCFDQQHQPYNCGTIAADVLSEQIGDSEIACAGRNKDRYGRTIAACSAGGRDLGDAMVHRGYAVDYFRYSKGFYAVAEREAREAKRGMWAGTFDWPDHVRRRERNLRYGR